MAEIKAATYKTPDGVERLLRFTHGARRRIVDRFGCNAKQALEKYSDGALPGILYACMYDEDGKPPLGLTIEQLEETVNSGDSVEMLAVFVETVANGKMEKNAGAKLRESLGRMISQKPTGTPSGVSPESTSGSPAAPQPAALTPESSGTSPNGNSGTSASDMPNVSEGLASIAE